MKSKADLRLVAFIDVLGFGNRVKRAKSPVELDSIDRDLSIVQREFQASKVDPDVREVHKYLGKSVRAFSDCVVVSVPLNSELTEISGSFDTLMSEVSNLAFAQARCAARGIFLRGGVEIGYWQERSGRLVSSALARAYDLERRERMPILGLADLPNKFFGRHRERNFYSPDSDPFTRTFLRYRDLKSGETFVFLDYLRIVINEIGSEFTREELQGIRKADPLEREAMAEASRDSNVRRYMGLHQTAIMKAYAQTQDHHVRLKYRWLAKYHNETVGRFRGADFSTLLIPARSIRPLSSRFTITRLQQRKSRPPHSIN
jgi:hypothetical protein